MFKKTLAAIVLSLVAVVAIPTAANAAGYVPSGNVSVSGSATPGGTDTVSFGAGSFNGSENVSFSVTGNGTATLSTFRAATVSLTKQASASGAVSVNVTLPSNASGTYTVTATGLTSGNVGTASITVSPADSAVGGSSNSGNGLADTGSTVPMLLVWGAAGAIILGFALFFVRGLVRRQRARA